MTGQFWPWKCIRVYGGLVPANERDSGVTVSMGAGGDSRQISNYKHMQMY